LSISRLFIKHSLTRANGIYRTRVVPVVGSGELVSKVTKNTRGTAHVVTTPTKVTSYIVRGKYAALYSLMMCNLAKTKKPLGLWIGCIMEPEMLLTTLP